jgi:hypothetical protein
MSKNKRSIKSETTIEKAMFKISLNFPVAPILAAANNSAKIAV